MIRKIIKINEEKCDGCGLCVEACHENAIGIINGKAVLLRVDYCDGLGDCLPVCPKDAISFHECEAVEYDNKTVINNMDTSSNSNIVCGCSDTNSKTNENISTDSKLRQWPIQIKLIPNNADYFNNADVLIAADCTAYSYGNFHNDFIKDKIILIGCPKLDEKKYAEKLIKILENNSIKSITVVRMEVPCCSGIVTAVKDALRLSGNIIPWKIVTISIQGKIINN